MRWRSGGPRNRVVVTYNGRPGACAAAALLLRYPDAGIYVSSSYHLARCLRSAGRNPDLSEVHILGMGYKGELLELRDAMQALRERGVEITWYSGGYWGSGFTEQVRDLCRLVMRDDTMSDALVVADELGLADNGRLPLLLDVSDMSREPSGLGAELAELVEAGKHRYFQFGDLDSYPTAIRKLAAQYPLTAEDRRAIRRFRAAGTSEGLDGVSPAIRRIKRNLSKYGRLDRVNVLVLGETGTGKERVAKLLHFASPRAEEPFFCENCATLSGEGLINSRLFGHVKGAFTGATSDAEGILDAADGGVLFLDEIGEMPPDTQAKLLRVLEHGTFTPVGSVTEKRADVRVIAATNRSFSELLSEGGFRLDLFYRLNQLVIEIPPLRERPEDIPYIAGSIRRELERKHDMELPDLTGRQCATLQSYDWPGNVRQLYNVLQKAWVLEMMDDLGLLLREQRRLIPEEAAASTDVDRPAPAEPMEAGDLVVAPASRSDVPPLEELVSEYARKALEAFDGNKTQTARALGISVNTLNKKLRG